MLGSGAAGIVCAVAALCLGDPFPWRVGWVEVWIFPRDASCFVLHHDRLHARLTFHLQASLFNCNVVRELQMGFAASFASKLADTTSSEIGKAYGRTTYLITTLQRVPRGTEGAVSLEGTAAGAAAAAGLGGIAYALGQVLWLCDLGPWR